MRVRFTPLSGMNPLGRMFARFAAIFAEKTDADTSAHPSPREIRASAQTNPGKVREANEDAVCFLKPSRAATLVERGALALVADGMGGVKGGSVASGIAHRVIPRAYLRSKASPPIALKEALEAANDEIFRRAQNDEKLRGMGTTCVALAVSPRRAWVAYVGDSRLYLIRNGAIFQMTEDHSLVQEMVNQGDLTPEEARSHESRNMVTRILGTKKQVEVTVWDEPFPVQSGDRFLLCSDGLHDLLTSEEMLARAGTGKLDAATSALIAAANARGGFDNISAVIVEVAERRRESSASLNQTRRLTEEDLRKL